MSNLMRTISNQLYFQPSAKILTRGVQMKTDRMAVAGSKAIGIGQIVAN
jgi:hypothetical protein